MNSRKQQLPKCNRATLPNKRGLFTGPWPMSVIRRTGNKEYFANSLMVSSTKNFPSGSPLSIKSPNKTALA